MLYSTWTVLLFLAKAIWNVALFPTVEETSVFQLPFPFLEGFPESVGNNRFVLVKLVDLEFSRPTVMDVLLILVQLSRHAFLLFFVTLFFIILVYFRIRIC